MRGIMTEASALLRIDLIRLRRNMNVSSNNNNIKNTIANKAYTTDCVVNELVEFDVVKDVDVILGAICKINFME